MSTESKTFGVKKPSFYIKTYGCQMNVYDSRMIASLFKREGLKETDNPEDADIIVVNTCKIKDLTPLLC